MNEFAAHRLLIRGTVERTLELNEHKGSALRGTLYHSLRNRFCTMRDAVDDCTTCPLWQVCPVCELVNTLAPDNRLGRDASRPYTVQPPLDGGKTRYEPGESIVFGLTLYGDVVRYFPYLAMALTAMEESGIGRRVADNDWQRGTFRIEDIWAENPLTGTRQRLAQAGDATVHMPETPITHEQVLAQADQLAKKPALTLDLLTPTRLTYRGRLVKPGRVTFDVFMARLFDRLESLAQHYCATPLKLDYGALLEQTAHVHTVADKTQWVELRSYSTRQQRATPIGGLIGRLTFVADDWTPYAPWLVWGQFTHIGKDTVKGNGWYRLRAG
ncbi:MAG TPA: CRISPR system precrRNA processing endoribonuclease RAMP protein Cas6 [Chloroflexi bacterium]|jgi:hypothetical protein|nr:CRISPR system precrRNA processing endoribonuclease RAMP protein Cas6 [Chloroflexota bacterium]